MSLLKKLFGRRPTIMDWRQFTEHYAEAARRDLGVQAEIQWGSDLETSSVIITLDNGTQGSCYMGNCYARYRQEPDNLEEILRQALLPVARMGSDIDDTVQPDHIVPVIKNTAYLQQLEELYRRYGKDPAEFVCSRPLAGDLVLIYMLDRSETMSNLDRGDLAAIGLADDTALYEQALANLRTLAESVQIARSDSNSLCQLMLDDTYDASLLLLAEDILAAAGIRLPGDTVLAVPARNTLLACSSEDAPALAHMRDIVQACGEEAPYQISSQLYVCHQGQLAPFQAN